MNHELSTYSEPMMPHAFGGLAGSQRTLLHMQQRTTWPRSLKY